MATEGAAFLLFFFVLAAGAVFTAVEGWRISKAWNAECRAWKGYQAWRDKNPDACNMHSEEGRRLVLARIEAYTYCLQIDKSLASSKFLDYLRGKLEECTCDNDPPEKESIPRIGPRPSMKAVSFCTHLR